MKNKKLLLVFLFAFFSFIFMPKANAQITDLRWFSDGYNSSGYIGSGGCWTGNPNTNTLSNVKYIRWGFDDTVTNGGQYTLHAVFTIESIGDYAWLTWNNGNSGVNIGGGYKIQSPTSAGTVNAYTTSLSGSRTLYTKRSSVTFDFTSSSNSSNNFLQLTVPVQPYSKICMNQFSVSGGSSTGGSTDTTTIINNNNQNTQNIISQNNQNTDRIVENQNQNTEDIINNQNSNTDKEIESQKVCKLYDKSSIIIDNKSLSINGGLGNDSNYGITDYINIYNAEVDKLNTFGSGVATCYYDFNKNLISCAYNSNIPTGIVTVPTNSYYMRVSIRKSENKPSYKICKNGNQALSDGVGDLNNNITNDNTDGATANANANITDFDIDNHGLADIFNTLTTFISNIASSTCSTLSFTLPFVHNEVTLPCMSTVYNQFPTFFTLYQLITTGLIAYRVSINLFQKVKQLSDPNYDKIEVVQL